MNFKNIGLTAAQFSISAVVNTALVPAAIAVGTVSTVAYVAKTATEAGTTGLIALQLKAFELAYTLETMKTN